MIYPDRAPGPASSGRGGLSLRWRLMLLVVAGIVPLLAFGLGYQYFEYREDTAAAGDNILSLVRSMTQLVDGELEARIVSLETLATSSALENGDIERFRARAAIAVNQFPGANIVLLREDGQQLVNLRIPPGEPLPVRGDLGSLQRVLATGHPAVSNLFWGSHSKRALIAIDVPVRRGDGTIKYVLSMNPRLDVFGDVIKRQNLPKNWISSVVDARGVNIARFPRADEFVGHQAAPSFLRALLAKPEDILESTSLEGIELVSAFSHSAKFGWAVGIGVPRADLINPVVTRSRAILAVGALLLAIALALATYVARGIARPIDSLRRLAAAADAEAPAALVTTGLPEVDEVAAALHHAEIERQRSRAAERVLRDSIENIPEGFAIFDADDRLVMCNESYRQLFPGRSNRVEVGATFAEMLRGGSPTGPGGEPNDGWVTARLRDHRDPGAAIEQELADGRWALVRNRPLANGGLAGLRIDITALKLVEDAFRHSEERFRRVVEAAPNAILLVDPDGKIEMVNAQAERIFGYSRAELVGKPIEILLPERNHAAHPGLRRGFLAEPRARLMGVGRDLYAARKDGKEFPVEVGLAPIETESGVQVLASVIDITERRQTEAQLRQAQKMEAIGNLTGGMAHDFNNLLGVIVGNLGLAQEQLGADDDLREMVDEALDAAWRGADLTRRLLAFARRQPLRPARIEVNELVSNTVRLLRRLLGEDIEVQLNLTAGLWPVIADPAQLGIGPGEPR
ncbi:MAG TPA: PAS domain S-box protein [Stellaceae bacterium]|nr:PAS domain S-box protein [Stellaceae bacterium]